MFFLCFCYAILMFFLRYFIVFFMFSNFSYYVFNVILMFFFSCEIFWVMDIYVHIHYHSPCILLSFIAIFINLKFPWSAIKSLISIDTVWQPYFSLEKYFQILWLEMVVRSNYLYFWLCFFNVFTNLFEFFLVFWILCYYVYFRYYVFFMFFFGFFYVWFMLIKWFFI